MKFIFIYSGTGTGNYLYIKVQDNQSCMKIVFFLVCFIILWANDLLRGPHPSQNMLIYGTNQSKNKLKHIKNNRKNIFLASD